MTSGNHLGVWSSEGHLSQVPGFWAHDLASRRAIKMSMPSFSSPPFQWLLCLLWFLHSVQYSGSTNYFKHSYNLTDYFHSDAYIPIKYSPRKISDHRYFPTRENLLCTLEVHWKLSWQLICKESFFSVRHIPLPGNLLDW